MAYKTFISVDELASQIGKPNWVVVDCRFDLDDTAAGHELYLEAHLPGAVYADLDHDLAGPPGAGTGRHPLPELNVLAATFSRLGISEDTQVVAYDLPYAARLWWLLRFSGHTSVAILDGGFGAWLAGGHETQEGEEQRLLANFKPRIATSMVIETAEILASLQSGGELLLVDSRSPERYRGEKEPRDPVAARIPGAVNRFWGDNLNSDGFIQPQAELLQAFQPLLGTFASRETAVYCGSGVTAAVNALAMEHAGLEHIRLYPGSWSMWCSDPARPIERG
ncbi:MAG: sulfurtransferase [Anaerolineales bacterium]|nr:sulfurtransferase [Anaerolineales bacterium]